MYNLEKNLLCNYPLRLLNDEIADPHSAIKSFHEYIDYPTARRYLQLWFKVIYKENYWTERSPNSLLYFYERVETLIEAAFLLAKVAPAKRVGVILLDEDEQINLLNPILYYPTSPKFNAWDYFPRHLSKKELLNPYLVFKKLFKDYKLYEWRYILHELLGIGLSNSQLEIDDEFNILLVNTHLEKLLEACSLIHTRGSKGFKGDAS
jgi:hypothetical protein